MGLIRRATVVAFCLLLAACGGEAPATDVQPAQTAGTPNASSGAPRFCGVQCIATAGGAAVRLDWEPAEDDETPQSGIRYEVFVADEPENFDPNAPLLTTAPGATSIILSGGDSPLVAMDQEAYYAVRAIDAEGNSDSNQVFARARPVAPSRVAFVDDTAAGAPSLGDPAAPYPTIQAAIDAVETLANGGIVLVSAEAGDGTTYGESITIAQQGTSNMGLYGGFPRFTPGTEGAALLATRDKEQYRTRLSQQPAAPCLRVANDFVDTDIDGFTFVDWNGTPYISAEDCDVLVSGCLLRDGGGIETDSSSGFIFSQLLMVVGNVFTDSGPYGVRVGGAYDAVLIGNNYIGDRDRGIEAASMHGSGLAVADTPFGLNLLVECNTIEFGERAMHLDFYPHDRQNGGRLSIDIQSNECRNQGDRAITMEGLADIGEDGAVRLRIAQNLVYGNGDAGITVESTTVQHAGVGFDYAITDNRVVLGDTTNIQVELTAVAGEETRLAVEDNLLMHGNYESIQITDAGEPEQEEADGANVHVGVKGNLVMAGTEEILIELGAPPGGLTDIVVTENTVVNGVDSALKIRAMEPWAESGTGNGNGPSGLICTNVFNNDLRSSRNEYLDLEDRRDVDDHQLRIVYVGNNLMGAGETGADDEGRVGGVDIENLAPYGLYLFQRNFIGMAGTNTGDSGFRIGHSEEDNLGGDPNYIRIENNVVGMFSGHGIQSVRRAPGVWVTNNTVVFNAKGGDNWDFGQEPNDRDRRSAVGSIDAWPNPLIENSILAYTGGPDLLPNVQAVYSLVRTQDPAIDFGNVGGEPLFSLGSGPELLSLFPLDLTLVGNSFALASQSPAVDAGRPAARFNDPDGSRNDMGAYGGPGAGTVGTLDGDTALPLVFMGSYPFLHHETGAPFWSPEDPITLVFNQAIDPATIAGNVVFRIAGQEIAGTLEPALGNKGIRFTLDIPGTPGGLNGSHIDAILSTGLTSASGEALRHPVTFRFSFDPGAAGDEGEANDDGDGVFGPGDIAAARPIVTPHFRIAGAITAIGADDLDVFEVSATAGQRITCTALRRRIGGEGAVALELYDAAGNVVAGSNYDDDGDNGEWDGSFGFTDANGEAGDPFLTYVANTTGTFYIVVRDGRWSAASDFGGDYELQGTVD